MTEENELTKAISTRRRMNSERFLISSLLALISLFAGYHGLRNYEHQLRSLCPACYEGLSSIYEMAGIKLEQSDHPQREIQVAKVAPKPVVSDTTVINTAPPSVSAPATTVPNPVVVPPTLPLNPSKPTGLEVRTAPTPTELNATAMGGSRFNKLTFIKANGLIPEAFRLPVTLERDVEQVESLTDGGAFVISQSHNGNWLQKILPNGLWDPSWEQQLRLAGEPQMVLRHRGAVLVVTKQSLPNQVVRFKVNRLLLTGEVDANFNADAEVDRPINDIVTDEEGRIWIVGSFGKFGGRICHKVLRMSPSGVVDKSFEFETYTYRNVQAIALDGQGQALLSVAYQNSLNQEIREVIRLTSDGKRDASFSPVTGFDQSPHVLRVDKKGRLLICGRFSTALGRPLKGFIQVTSTGAPIAPESSILDGACESVSLSHDGGIWVGGAFGRVRGVQSPRLVKLDPNGATDKSVNVRLGFDRSVKSVSSTKDGVWVGGHFQRYNAPDQSFPLVLDNNLNPEISKPSGNSLSFAGPLIGKDPFEQVYSSAPHNLTSMIQKRNHLFKQKLPVAVACDGPDSCWVGGAFSNWEGHPAHHMVILTTKGVYKSDVPGWKAKGIPRKIWKTAKGALVFSKGEGELAEASLHQIDSLGNRLGDLQLESAPHRTLIDADLDPSGAVFVILADVSGREAGMVRLARILSDGKLDPEFTCQLQIQASSVEGVVALSEGRALILGTLGEHGFEEVKTRDPACRVREPLRPWVRGLSAQRDQKGNVILQRSILVATEYERASTASP